MSDRHLSVDFCCSCGGVLIRVTGIPENIACKMCDRVVDGDVLNSRGVYACGKRVRGAAPVGDGHDVVDVNNVKFSECGMIVCVDCQQGSIGTLRAREVSRVVIHVKQVAPGGAGAAASAGVARDDRFCPLCNPTWASSVIVLCDQHQKADGSTECPADCSTDMRWITSTSYRCERCHQAGEPDVDLSASGTRMLHECSKCGTRYYYLHIGTPREPPARAGTRRARSPEVKEESNNE